MTLSELKAFFQGRPLPAEAWLGPGQRIADPKKLMTHSIAVLEANPGNPAKMNYYERLRKLKEAIDTPAS